MLVEEGQPLSISGVYISAECLACESQAMARSRWPLPPLLLITLPCALPVKVRILSVGECEGADPAHLIVDDVMVVECGRRRDCPTLS